MTPEQRREAARKAVRARWAKPGARDKPAVPIEACRRGGRKGGAVVAARRLRELRAYLKEHDLLPTPEELEAIRRDFGIQ